MNHRTLIVIPARNEEAAIAGTLKELLPCLSEQQTVAVGLNACSDRTAGVCARFPVLVGERGEAGYGHGCLAAIEKAEREGVAFDSILFYAADGANRPEDALRLIRHFEDDSNARFLMGIRQFTLRGWWEEFGRALPNLLLGIVCQAMGGQFFHDLGPLRLIEKDLFARMHLRELVWGWTIEAQIRAEQLDEPIVAIPVQERERKAGDQKVSGVSTWRSLRIGCAIAAAAVRTRFRYDRTDGSSDGKVDSRT